MGTLFRRFRTKFATTGEPPLRCSFCNKDQSDVHSLIAGPAVFICDACVRTCNDILADRSEASAAAAAEVEPATRVLRCSSCGMVVPWEEGLSIPERGVPCPGCGGAVEGALPEKGDR